MSAPTPLIARDGPAEYALGFSAVPGGVQFDLAADGFALSLLMAPAEAKLAAEMLLAAYGTAFHRFPHGVPITHKKEG